MWRIADQLRIWPRIAYFAYEEVRIVDPKQTLDNGSLDVPCRYVGIFSTMFRIGHFSFQKY